MGKIGDMSRQLLKRFLLILTLLIPTMAMSEVVEVNCTNDGDANTLTTYRFDLDKKTVSYATLNISLRSEYPLEVFESYPPP
jgi:hypothetical protein